MWAALGHFRECAVEGLLWARMWATLGPLWWMCCGRTVDILWIRECAVEGLLWPTLGHFGGCAVEGLVASVGYSGTTCAMEGLVFASVLKAQVLKI